MSSIDTSSDTSTQAPQAGTIDMKLEVVNLPFSDVDRAKRFYQNLGWRLDGDFAVGEDFRAVQLTPPNSQASITFGKGVTTAVPGSFQDLMLIVSDIDAAREDLISRGVDVSEVDHYETRPFHSAGTEHACRARTRKAAPTSPGPRSAIRTATAGCSKSSRRGCPDASGRTRPWTLRRWQTSCTRQPTITTPTKRPLRRTTGGTGTQPTSAPASRGARRRRHPPPPGATWRKSDMFFLDDFARLSSLRAREPTRAPMVHRHRR